VRWIVDPSVNTSSGINYRDVCKFLSARNIIIIILFVVDSCRVIYTRNLHRVWFLFSTSNARISIVFNTFTRLRICGTNIHYRREAFRYVKNVSSMDFCTRLENAYGPRVLRKQIVETFLYEGRGLDIRC